MKRLLLVTMGAASFLLSPAQQLLTDGSVPLESLYISDLSFFYDADGDGVKEYYAIGEGQWRNENNRYVWRAPGCYVRENALDFGTIA